MNPKTMILRPSWAVQLSRWKLEKDLSGLLKSNRVRTVAQTEARIGGTYEWDWAIYATVEVAVGGCGTLTGH